MSAEPARVAERLTLPALARLWNVAEEALRRGIRTGRLERSVHREGRKVLIDPSVAAAEWRINRGEDKNPAAAFVSDSSIAAARRKVLEEQAAKLRLEREIKTGAYVLARAVETRWSGIATRVRNAVEGIPSRAKTRLPHLTPADCVALADLCRDVLEELVP